MTAVGDTDEARADIPEAEDRDEHGAFDGSEDGADEHGEGDERDDAPPERTGMTPRQARRVRAVVSAVVMVAVAVALVVRMEYGLSLVMVGLYGVALILCGTAITLSRRGRTRVATAVLAAGFAVVAAAEWFTPTAV
jgi:hypothetical protein